MSHFIPQNYTSAVCLWAFDSYDIHQMSYYSDIILIENKVYIKKIITFLFLSRIERLTPTISVPVIFPFSFFKLNVDVNVFLIKIKFTLKK